MIARGYQPGEGNGNPLQCSCLENPRDRGAWWVAVYGVAQSRTRLKRLSSRGYQRGDESSKDRGFLGFLGKYSVLLLSRSVVSNSVISWTVACQAPLSLGFSRQEYWSLLPFCSPEDLLNPGIEHRLLVLQADSLLFEPRAAC